MVLSQSALEAEKTPWRGEGEGCDWARKGAGTFAANKRVLARKARLDVDTQLQQCHFLIGFGTFTTSSLRAGRQAICPLCQPRDVSDNRIEPLLISSNGSWDIVTNMASTGVLGTTLINFSTDGSFPEEESVSAARVEESALPGALVALNAAKTALEVSS